MLLGIFTLQYPLVIKRGNGKSMKTPYKWRCSWENLVQNATHGDHGGFSNLWLADLRRLTPFGRDLSPPKHCFRSWYCCINIAGKPRFSGTAAGKPQFSLKCTKLSVFVLDWFLMALLAANWAAPVSSLRHRIWTQWMEQWLMFDCILPTIERKCIW